MVENDESGYFLEVRLGGLLVLTKNFIVFLCFGLFSRQFCYAAPAGLDLTILWWDYRHVPPCWAESIFY